MSATTRYEYPLSLPASASETAARPARDEGVWLKQWIAAAVAQRIGAVETDARPQHSPRRSRTGLARGEGPDAGYTQPVGFGSPAYRHACLAGP